MSYPLQTLTHALNVIYVAVFAGLDAHGAAELNLNDTLEKGLQRLLEKPTWKLWQWSPEGRQFSDANSFR